RLAGVDLGEILLHQVVFADVAGGILFGVDDVRVIGRKALVDLRVLGLLSRRDGPSRHTALALYRHPAIAAQKRLHLVAEYLLRVTAGELEGLQRVGLLGRFGGRCRRTRLRRRLLRGGRQGLLRLREELGLRRITVLEDDRALRRDLAYQLAVSHQRSTGTLRDRGR